MTTEQITMIQTRETLVVMRKLIPILSQNELVELMQFNNKVLNRYIKEHYPNGLPEEEAE